MTSIKVESCEPKKWTESLYKIQNIQRKLVWICSNVEIMRNVAITGFELVLDGCFLFLVESSASFLQLVGSRWGVWDLT